MGWIVPLGEVLNKEPIASHARLGRLRWARLIGLFGSIALPTLQWNLPWVISCQSLIRLGQDNSPGSNLRFLLVQNYP